MEVVGISWFTELFINQAKPALEYHRGLGNGSDDTQMYILVDEEGNEYPAVFVDEETVFDATANDIREGKVAATEDGVTTGTKEIPAYITTEGSQLIPVGGQFAIRMRANRCEFTKLQVLICAYQSSLAASVATEKVSINGKVYEVGSTEELAEVTVDVDNGQINLGITNEGDTPRVIRYFTFKEEA